jgi:DNA-binding LacI/PurR family transcriptional regulator
VDNRFWDVLQQQAQRITDDESPKQFRIYRQIGDPHDAAQTQQLLDDINMHRLAGLIFLRPNGLEYVPDIAQWYGKLPMVMFAMDVPHRSIHRVRFDHQIFADQSMQTLKQRGCQRIATFMYPGYARLEDWPQQIRQHRMTTQPHLQHIIARDLPGSARSIAQLMMKLPADQRPDGILLGDDNLIEPVIGGLLDTGTRVGQDIHIVSRGNWPCAAMTMVPVTQFGYDMIDAMSQAIALIDKQRRTGRTAGSIIDLKLKNVEELQAQYADR